MVNGLKDGIKMENPNTLRGIDAGKLKLHEIDIEDLVEGINGDLETQG